MLGKVQSRLNRILLMVPYMAVEEGASLTELSRKFGVSKAQIMDDLNVVWLCGLPGYGPGDLIDFQVEGDRVKVSMADYFARPLTLTWEEALALVIAGKALIRAKVFKEKGPLSSALTAVQELLSETEAGELATDEKRIDVEMDVYSGGLRRIIDEGLERGRDLVLEYYSFSRGEVTTREVEPLSLIWSMGHWYLQAWCREAADMRLFRLDRIKSVELGGKHPPREEELALPELVGEYKPGKKAHRVKLRFSGAEGRRLVEQWPAAKVIERKDHVLVELRTRNLSWLSTYLLRFGDRVRIESPRELAAMVERQAKELLEVYQ